MQWFFLKLPSVLAFRLLLEYLESVGESQAFMRGLTRALGDACGLFYPGLLLCQELRIFSWNEFLETLGGVIVLRMRKINSSERTLPDLIQHKLKSRICTVVFLLRCACLLCENKVFGCGAG